MIDRANKAFLRNLSELYAVSIKYLDYLQWKKEQSGNVVIHKSKVFFPKIESKEICLFEGWFNGESLVKIDGQPFGQLNEVQGKIIINNNLCDGKHHNIVIETVPRSLFGVFTGEVKHVRSRIVVHDEELLSALYYLKELIRLHGKVTGYERTYIEKNLKKFFSELLPCRVGDVYIKSLTEDTESRKELERIWNPYRKKLDKPVFNKEFKSLFLKKLERLKSLLSHIPMSYRTVYLFANTHIDYAWL